MVKGEVKSIFKVISSNSVNMLIGIITAFIIPGLLGPEQYGYYSLFALYASYVGFLLFGYCDGFYLVYGGTSYQQLDKKLFSSYFYLMVIYLISISAFLAIYINYCYPVGYKLAILNLVILGGFFQNINGYFILLNQASSRFSIYAIGHVIEKVIFLIGVVLSFYIKSSSAFYVIALIIIGKIFTSVYFIYYSRDIVFMKPHFDKEVFDGARSNIKAGLLLTLSAVGTMLMTGIGRFAIENRIGITQLGYYSFTFSVTVLFTQILSAISVVLYPLLRKYDSNQAKNMVNKLDRLIMYVSGIVLLSYYPGRFLLELLFPKYKAGMDVLLYLLPIVICESRRLIVYNMIYKVMRMEKQLVQNVVISLLFCLAITLIGLEFTSSIEMVAAMTYISLLVWNTITILLYNKKTQSKEKLFGKDFLQCIGYFVLFYMFRYTVTGFVLSIVFISLTYVFDYKNALYIYKEWKMILGDKE